MPLYVMLGNLKSEAFATIDGIEERDRRLANLMESLGGRIVGLYYMIGRYDFVLIFDMEKKEDLVRFLAILAKHGSVRTETLETIPADMFYRVSKQV
ncbi:MAG TPA: GYD domain-containing protein [Methanoregulaceae archaeon]|nr:GYD domain-containing protein [Methanoregulaceae archaeon]HOV66988.1 GYD domain-containing protein [Methanoregulaceae archaeon]HQJ87502.1 GYD domain-containing protein [Methanoregulaceae archaeon]